MFIQPYQPTRVLKWQGLQQHRSNDGKQRNICANADGNHEDRQERKSRCPGQCAHADSHIPQSHLNVMPTPGFARLLAQPRRISERASRRVTSLFKTHSGSDVFGYLLLEMKAKLGIEALYFPSTMEKHFHSHADFFQPAHRSSFSR